MLIKNLRVNHFENVLGFNTDSGVTFTYVAESSGKKSEWAQIIVALDKDFNNIIHDSGKCNAVNGLCYSPEISLLPRTQYYWKVVVCADNGDIGESDIQCFETGKRDEPFSASWIKAPYDKKIHPIIKTKIAVNKQVLKARAYVTAMGLYEMYINGKKAGDEVLTPFYNDYDTWQQVVTLDITNQIIKGENEISFMLGNGWYKGRFGFGEDNDELYGDQMAVLSEIRLFYTDGTEETIGTNNTWQCAKSPVLDSNIYDGEIYDARLEDISQEWVPAVNATPCKGKLTDRLSPELKIIKTLAPQKLIITPKGEQVIDVGQNMTGWVEFDCDLAKGQEVLIEHGELLQHDNFYTENLRTAKEQFKYIGKGGKAHVRPHFTFYGFRFIKVTGMDVNLNDFTFCVIHSNIKNTGSVETSNEKINRLIKNAYWGQIGNFVDTPTDCPQRDERMGWTGDAHMFSGTANFNMYTPAFYEKFLYDMRGEQKKNDGCVPHVIPDVISRIIRNKGQQSNNMGSCAWADCATGMAWNNYKFFGDKKLLSKQYENMKLWTEWMIKSIAENGDGRQLFMHGDHYADWLALDNPILGSSFGGTDKYYIASVFYYYSVNLTCKAAKVLGYNDDAAKYEALSNQILKDFRDEFITNTGRVAEPTQTAIVLALNMGLVPDEFIERNKKRLIEKLKSRDMHLDTGFVGTYFLCPTLSKFGLSDIAYTLLLNEDYPSWLYEVNMGATTIWERWNSVMPNGLVSDTGMNSLNHYTYGSIVEWMYSYMCGLMPNDMAPGFKYINIAPMPNKCFTYAKARYDSASGTYESGWEIVNGKAVFTITVPFDCEAKFIAPKRGEYTVNGIKFEGETQLSSGTYVIHEL